MKIEVSIVIVHYNTFDLTQKCIKSISETEDLTEIDLEICLVINGEVDKEVKFLEFFSISTKLIYAGNNLGFSKAVNIGIKNSKFESILLLNSDAYFYREGTIKRCLQQLLNLGNVYLTPRLLNSEKGPEQVSFVKLPSLTKELFDSFFLYKFFYTKKRHNNYDLNGYYLVATCLFFQKKELRKLKNEKLYDEMFLYGEELFWGKDFKDLGLYPYYYKNESIIHEIGGSSGKGSPKRREYQTRGEDLFLRERHSKSRLLIYVLRLIRWSFILLINDDKDLATKKRVLIKMLKE